MVSKLRMIWKQTVLQRLVAAGRPTMLPPGNGGGLNSRKIADIAGERPLAEASWSLFHAKYDAARGMNRPF